MNELIQQIFADFVVDNVSVPVKYLHYEGHGEPYVVYGQYDAQNSFSADNDLQGYVVYYDFDVYSKGNYYKIVKKIKEKLKQNGFVFQPSRSSREMYETDTQYYHKTLCFAAYQMEV